MPKFEKSKGFKLPGTEFYGYGNQSPVKNRAADPLAKGEETTRTSKNLVTGGTNTVAKYATPTKMIPAGAASAAAGAGGAGGAGGMMSMMGGAGGGGGEKKEKKKKGILGKIFGG